MTDKISFDLVSPERLLLSEQADMVTVPGSDGYFGVLTGHMPLISTLRPGMIDVKGGDKGDAKYFILGGFAEVNTAGMTNTKLTVLAEEAVPMTEMDITALDQRIHDAEENLIAASTPVGRAKAADILADLRLVRAAF
ncbi:MAG: F0F1 ATP synthase subunit epsilon [Rhizomicrobium sp.]|jgi:F-type H+-transporting ATPase subunit epsilon